MNSIGITAATQGQLDARWRDLQKAIAQTSNAAEIEINAREMAAILAELERRRAAREMELTR